MSLKIYSAENLPVDQWSILTKNSLYCSAEFVRLWRTMNGRDIFFLEEDNNRIVAGMAGVMFGRSFLSRFQSMPDGVYGGPYYNENRTTDDKSQFIHSVFDWLQSEKILRIDIHNPSDRIEDNNFQRRDMVTHVIELEGESFEPPDNKIREHIRTGKRRGASVKIFDDVGSIDAFFELVKKTSRRHNEKPRFPKDWFRELLKISLVDERILWLAVIAEDKIIGSRICFIDRYQLLTWQYYSDKSYGHLKPGYLLLDFILNYALKRKIKAVNLGWSPPEAESLRDYKIRWGGREKTLDYYTYFSRLGNLIYRRR
jgi:hypothetical protein